MRNRGRSDERFCAMDVLAGAAGRSGPGDGPARSEHPDRGVLRVPAAVHGRRLRHRAPRIPKRGQGRRPQSARAVDRFDLLLHDDRRVPVADGRIVQSPGSVHGGGETGGVVQQLVVEREVPRPAGAGGGHGPAGQPLGRQHPERPDRPRPGSDADLQRAARQPGCAQAGRRDRRAGVPSRQRQGDHPLHGGGHSPPEGAVGAVEPARSADGPVADRAVAAARASQPLVPGVDQFRTGPGLPGGRQNRPGGRRVDEVADAGRYVRPRADAAGTAGAGQAGIRPGTVQGSRRILPGSQLLRRGVRTIRRTGRGFPLGPDDPSGVRSGRHVRAARPGRHLVAARVPGAPRLAAADGGRERREPGPDRGCGQTADPDPAVGRIAGNGGRNAGGPLPLPIRAGQLPTRRSGRRTGRIQQGHDVPEGHVPLAAADRIGRCRVHLRRRGAADRGRAVHRAAPRADTARLDGRSDGGVGRDADLPGGRPGPLVRDRLGPQGAGESARHRRTHPPPSLSQLAGHGRPAAGPAVDPGSSRSRPVPRRPPAASGSAEPLSRLRPTGRPVRRTAETAGSLAPGQQRCQGDPPAGSAAGGSRQGRRRPGIDPEPDCASAASRPSWYSRRSGR